ncbi:hypothetical protein [Streptomyces cucumeris]|uniref:hypothetical protein n=1 Tax=Streptomyces cucumeris TaxID=2962890 RepID=UPI003D703CAF
MPVVGECLGRDVGEVVEVDEGLPAITGGQPELALLPELSATRRGTRRAVGESARLL